MKFRGILVKLGLVAAKVAAKFDPTGVANGLLEAYGKYSDKQQLKLDLEAIMRASFAEFREELAEAMLELRPQLEDDEPETVEKYLSQLQSSAKQASRCLGDPTATTIPPTVGVDDPSQLANFLPQRPPRFTVGDAVPGLPSWILSEPLGSGGFGEVWKADNPYFGSTVFKFFLDSGARARFTRAEAAALAEVHRRAPAEGIVKLLGAEPAQDPPWLQFEHVGGGDLAGLPHAWKDLSPEHRLERVRSVMLSLAAVAGHLHAIGVVHRDFKPSNILLRERGNERSLVVTDFGISRIIPSGLSIAPTPRNASLETIRAYTATYASPQQRKFLPADRRDDIYALGVLWYQLIRGDLTLERPSGEGWKRALTRLGVRDNEISLINRCWDDEQDERPENGNDFLANLRGETPNAQSISYDPSFASGFFISPQRSTVRDHLIRSGSEPLPGEVVHFPLPVTGHLTMAFCWIPPGIAQLGSPEAEQHAVAAYINRKPEGYEREGRRGKYVSKGFWLGKYLMTQQEWRELTGHSPSYFQTSTDGAVFVKGLNTDRFPVENVSYEDICNPGGILERLNAHDGIQTAFGRPGKFSLPHEDQWEYACRGGRGNKQAYYWGDALNGSQANVNGAFPFGTALGGPYIQRPSVVGSYEQVSPHPWGLCDMIGNVSEWCGNLFEGSTDRAMKGGSWYELACECRSASRFSIAPDNRNTSLGCRLCFTWDDSQ